MAAYLDWSVRLSYNQTMKKRLLIAIIPVAVLLAGPWVIPTLTPWAAVNVHHEEINIKTGQARYSHKLWYIKVSERVEDTLFSKVLAGEAVDVADIEPWHMVNTFSPGRRLLAKLRVSRRPCPGTYARNDLQIA